MAGRPTSMTLVPEGIKMLTRALACMSRYGDDITIHVDTDSFCVSATNSSETAYCKFRYERLFFSRYYANINYGESFEAGKLSAKTLLSILKNRSFENAVDRCEISIAEGNPDEREDQDSLASNMIIRLFCKHGVIKTHRIVLSVPLCIGAPCVPESAAESRLTMGPKSIRSMLRHFPPGGPKQDPQLVWVFTYTDVTVHWAKSPLDLKHKEISTQMKLEVTEFETYELASSPITIAFHMREFCATIAYAESMDLTLDLCFTNGADPLFINVRAERGDALFIIGSATAPEDLVKSSQQSQSKSQEASSKTRKRGSESVATTETRASKAVKVVKEMPTTSRSRTPAATPSSSVTPQQKKQTAHDPSQFAAPPSPPPSDAIAPSAIPSTSAPPRKIAGDVVRCDSTPPQRPPSLQPPPKPLSYSRSIQIPNNADVQPVRCPADSGPLFYPSSSQPPGPSQLLPAEIDMLRQSGLDVSDDMTQEEFMEMFEDVDEEVVGGKHSDGSRAREMPETIQFAPTPSSLNGSLSSFRPLFED